MKSSPLNTFKNKPLLKYRFILNFLYGYFFMTLFFSLYILSQFIYSQMVTTCESKTSFKGKLTNVKPNQTKRNEKANYNGKHFSAFFS